MAADAVSAYTAAEQREQERDYTRDQRDGYRAGKQPGDPSHGPTGYKRPGKSAQNGAQHPAHYE